MNKFALGLVVGSAAGFVFSLFKDENGNRVGKPLKREYDGFKHDATDFKHSIQSFKNSSNKLNDSLPTAQRAVSDIGDEVNHYQTRSNKILKNMKKQSDQLNQHLGNDTKKN